MTDMKVAQILPVHSGSPQSLLSEISAQLHNLIINNTSNIKFNFKNSNLIIFNCVFLQV